MVIHIDKQSLWMLQLPNAEYKMFKKKEVEKILKIKKTIKINHEDSRT